MKHSQKPLLKDLKKANMNCVKNLIRLADICRPNDEGVRSDGFICAAAARQTMYSPSPYVEYPFYFPLLFSSLPVAFLCLSSIPIPCYQMYISKYDVFSPLFGDAGRQSP